MIWIPTNILPDVVQAEKKNAQLKQIRQLEQPIPFKPIPYNKSNILWWHVPEFLEDNRKNQTVEKLVNGKRFWINRQDRLIEFSNAKIIPYINEMEDYFNDDSRLDLFNKIYDFIEGSCINRIGNHISGLYVDFEEFKNIFTLSPKEAERIIDNNIFVGDMATFYSAAVENHESMEKCERLKKEYIKSVEMVSSSKNIHLISKGKVQNELFEQFLKVKPGDTLHYETMLDEHLETMHKVEKNDRAF